MFNMDAGKMAKGAMEGLQKAGKGGTAEAAKGMLDAVKGGSAPEQLLEALRKLLAEAKKAAAAGKNEPLEKAIEKAEDLLKSEKPSTEAVTKLTAELTTLLKGAGAAKPDASPKPAGTERSAAPAAAAAAKPAAAPAKAEEVKKVEFSDVDAGAYYYDAVQWAVNKGIASGTSETTFSPDKTCTFAQAITFLWRAAGSPEPKSQTNPYSDVKEGGYYYKAALWASERGMVPGSAFTPDASVTRSQVALFLYRNAGSPAVKASAGFQDVPETADYAKAVAWVAEKGIASGTKDNRFNPDNACTRGQIVTFLYRAKK